MRLSQFHLRTSKQTPAEAELISHRLMLKAGMIRKLASGLYTWSPLGLRVLRKVERVVREEMDAAGAIELLMPTVQPRELWQETGRWDKFGGQLLKLQDRKQAWYCYGPTHEEVMTDFARDELASYKQLPVTFYQIQTKFRDEIRPRFGVMRAREFMMKDAYSFHVDDADLDRQYQVMYAAYTRVFKRLGLKFRAVAADTGAIGGSASHEFHVLADSGEDAIAFSSDSEYAANIELATTTNNHPAAEQRPPPAAPLRQVETPAVKSVGEVAAFLELPLARMVTAQAFTGADADGQPQFVLVLVRGDHAVNEFKLGRLPGLAGYRRATDDEVGKHLGVKPRCLGPVDPPRAIRVVADHAVAALADFAVAANRPGCHLAGVNWERDLPLPAADDIADIRNVVEGDPSPDGHGTLAIARGIEVGHIFQLGRGYAQAMQCNVLDQAGKAITPTMGCYGIGVSRIVAAAIEQNHDQRGICWPAALAPWQVVVCIINPKHDPAVAEAADGLYRQLNEAGIEAALDDRGLRPGTMFADIELIGIPHRVVVSERGLAAGSFEYRARRVDAAENLDRETLLERLRA